MDRLLGEYLSDESNTFADFNEAKKKLDSYNARARVSKFIIAAILLVGPLMFVNDAAQIIWLVVGLPVVVALTLFIVAGNKPETEALAAASHKYNESVLNTSDYVERNTAKLSVDMPEER